MIMLKFGKTKSTQEKDFYDKKKATKNLGG